jgi:cold shock protein
VIGAAWRRLVRHRRIQLIRNPIARRRQRAASSWTSIAVAPVNNQLAKRLTTPVEERTRGRADRRGDGTTMNGTVKFFNPAKGFGFIEPDDGGKDVFVHASALEAAGIRVLNEGDRVSFILEDDRRGRGKQAGQVKKI